MSNYVGIWWLCGLALLLNVGVLSSTTPTPYSQSVSESIFDSTESDSNETMEVLSLEIDDTRDLTSCKNDADCNNEVKLTLPESWLCNTTISKCQLHCSSGYRSYKGRCRKAKKRKFPAAIVFDTVQSGLKVVSTSIEIGSPCEPRSNTCENVLRAVCVENKCTCKMPYPLKGAFGYCVEIAVKDGDPCEVTAQCPQLMKCDMGKCRRVDTIASQTEAFLLGFGVFVIVLLSFIAFLGFIARKGRFHQSRHRRTRARSDSTGFTSSTLELMAEFRDPPPAYSDCFMVGRNRVVNKPPSYDEAVKLGETGWTSAQLQVPSVSTPVENNENSREVGGSLVMGEASSTSINVEVLRSELRRYPRDNQVQTTQSFPELVESNV